MGLIYGPRATKQFEIAWTLPGPQRDSDSRILIIFMLESQLVQMPGPRDIVIYRPSPREFSVAQKPWGWAHILVQKPRGARGVGGGNRSN